MKIVIVFVLLNVCGFCRSNYVDENFFDVNSPPPNIGRPTKVIIDEIITRSVSFPARSRFGSNFRSTNYPSDDYPSQDYPSTNYPSEDYQSRGYPLNDFMLTNRRRDDSTDNSGYVEGEENFFGVFVFAE